MKEEKLSNLKLITKLKYDFKLDKKVNLFSEILVLNAD